MPVAHSDISLDWPVVASSKLPPRLQAMVLSATARGLQRSSPDGLSSCIRRAPHATSLLLQRPFRQAALRCTEPSRLEGPSILCFLILPIALRCRASQRASNRAAKPARCCLPPGPATYDLHACGLGTSEIVGSGPAGFYTSKYLFKKKDRLGTLEPQTLKPQNPKP